MGQFWSVRWRRCQTVWSPGGLHCPLSRGSPRILSHDARIPRMPWKKSDSIEASPIFKWTTLDSHLFLKKIFLVLHDSRCPCLGYRPLCLGVRGCRPRSTFINHQPGLKAGRGLGSFEVPMNLRTARGCE